MKNFHNLKKIYEKQKTLSCQIKNVKKKRKKQKKFVEI